MSKDKNIKTITAGIILSWIFGILFLILGIGITINSIYLIFIREVGNVASLICGIITILCSVMLLPFSNKLIEKKFRFKIYGWLKFILIIIIFIVINIAEILLSVVG